MIRNLFILSFAACLIDNSQCDRNFGFRSSAYDNFDIYEENEESPRMQYGDYYLSDTENQAGFNRDAAEVLNKASESVKNTKEKRPPIDVTNAAKTSSKTGRSAALDSIKVPANNKRSETKPPNVMNPVLKPKTLDTKQKTNTKPTNLSHSEINLYPKQSTKVTPVRRLVTIKYSDNPEVEESLPRFRPNKDVYIMLPGFLESKNSSYQEEDYVRKFFTLISRGLLASCDCTVIGVRWSFDKFYESKPFIQYRAAIITGRKLGNAINEMRKKINLRASLTVIGHDLGNMIAASLANVLRKPVDYIYGLDQRLLHHPQHRNFYLRQDSGRVVQTLTTNGMKNNYGHRNFYPSGGNFSYAPGHEDQCFFCYSYQLFSDDILQHGLGHPSTFCSTYEDYISDYCEQFSQVSYFNRYSPDQLPRGNYFIAEQVNIPKMGVKPFDN